MLGIFFGLVVGLGLLVLLFRRPTLVRMGIGYAWDRPLLLALIALGLTVGTGVIAAAGIAGDSAGESYLRGLAEQSAGVDGAIDASRRGLDPAFEMTAESAARLVRHPRLSPLVADHAAGMRATMEVGTTPEAGRTMTVLGIDAQSYGRIMGWNALEGELPRGAQGPGVTEIVLNEAAAIALDRGVGDMLHLISERTEHYRVLREREDWRKEGHLVLAMQAPHPIQPEYHHSPQDQYEFTFLLEDRQSGFSPSPPLLFFNATAAADVDLHLEVITPSGASTLDASPGPEAQLYWHGVHEFGEWTVRVHSALAAGVDVHVDIALIRTHVEFSVASVTHEGKVVAVVPTKGSDPLAFGPAVFLPLSRLQTIVERPGHVNMVLVSAVAGTDPPELRAALEAADAATWGGGSMIRVPQADPGAERLRADVHRFLLIFSTFTLVSGVLLIFVIMALLVEDRKRTIAVMRAVGAQRRDIVRMYVAEGIVYAGLAAIAGVLLGIILVLLLSKPLGGSFGLGAGTYRLTLRPMTLVGAVAAGFALTTLTIAFAARRAGRLDVPLALRGEEPVRPPRNRMGALRAFVMAALGGAFAAAGLGLGWPALTYLGLVAVVIGISWVISRSLRRRTFVLLDAVLVLILSLLFLQFVDFEKLSTALLFPVLTIGLALSAAIVLVYAKPVHGAVVAAAGKVRGIAPLVEAALAHLRSRPGRSALVTGVLATVLLITTVFVGLFAALDAPDWGDAGGFRVVGDTTAAIHDPVQHLAGFPPRGGQDPYAKAHLIVATPWLATPAMAPAAGLGDPDADWIRTPTSALGESIIGVTPEFAARARFKSGEVAAGYADLAAAFRAVQRDPGLVIVADHMFISRQHEPGPGGPGSEIRLGDRLTLKHPVAERPRPELEVIAILGASGVAGIYVHPDVLLEIEERSRWQAGTRLWAIPARGVGDAAFAQDLEGAFRSVALEATVVSDPFPEQRAEARNMQLIFGSYLGIGVLVGIAGIGLISVRSVLVRRREIGTLRACGATRQQIERMFTFEAFYVTLAAIAIGFIGALLVAEALLKNHDVLAIAILDWRLLLPFYGATIAASMLMAYLTARQAARMDPSKALHYAE